MDNLHGAVPGHSGSVQLQFGFSHCFLPRICCTLFRSRDYKPHIHKYKYILCIVIAARFVSRTSQQKSILFVGLYKTVQTQCLGNEEPLHVIFS